MRNEANYSNTAVRRAQIGVFTGMLAGAAAAYVFKIRPWVLQWGATGEEVSDPLPGDAIVPSPHYQATHAVTIQAPPEAVWPWLVQMGPARGGYYSYDWLEHAIGLDIHSVDRTVPEWQGLRQGDIIANSREKPDEGVEVAVLEPNSALVYHGTIVPGQPMNHYPIVYDQASEGWFDFTWGFFLRPIDGDSCRLIARCRIGYKPGIRTVAFHLLLEPQHFIMERKMLLGIKERAERSRAAASPADSPALETLVFA